MRHAACGAHAPLRQHIICLLGPSSWQGGVALPWGIVGGGGAVVPSCCPPPPPAPPRRRWTPGTCTGSPCKPLGGRSSSSCCNPTAKRYIVVRIPLPHCGYLLATCPPGVGGKAPSVTVAGLLPLAPARAPQSRNSALCVYAHVWVACEQVGTHPRPLCLAPPPWTTTRHDTVRGRGRGGGGVCTSGETSAGPA